MTDMRMNLEGYVPEPGRGGKTRHRVRVKGNPKKRITIPFGPEHEEFLPHYNAARKGLVLEVEQQEEPETEVHKDSLDAAFERYLAHLEKRVNNGLLATGTLNQRKSLFKTAGEFQSPDGIRIGDYDYRLTTEALEHVRDEWGERTAQADNCTKAFVDLYKWLKVKPNPATDVAKVHISKGGAKPWTIEEVKAFMKAHPEGSAARLWLLLAMFTGARIGDLAILGRGHEVQRDGITWLEWQPQKKGSAFVSIPIAPQLFEACRSMKVQGRTYLLNAHGRPFRNGAVLGVRVQRWTKDAGLENRSSHGLRKALATLLAEMGCSTHQIMSVLAHNKASTSEVYTRSAERSRLAKSAFESIQHVRF